MTTTSQGELLAAEAGAGAADDGGADGFAGKSLSRNREALRRYLHNPIAMAALIVFVGMVLVSYIYPYFYKWKYDEVDISLIPPSQKPGSHGHILGTDDTGYDLLARIMRGTVRDFEIAIVSLVIALIIGIVLGALAGYYGGITDNLIMRFVDLLLTIPSLVILIVAASKYPNLAGKALGIAILIGLFGWLGLSRLIRGQFLSLREREFVEAAHAMGAKDSRIIFRHLIPNALGTVLVFATLFAASSIIAETSLTFLGYGVQPPDTSLGLLISRGVDAADTRPWLFYYPGIVVLVFVLSVNLIGEGIRDAFDPKHSRVRD